MNKIQIIAEAGVNHNGSLMTAYKLIDVAKKSGADSIKFQIFQTDDLVTSNAPLAEYQKNKKILNQKNLLKNLELPQSDFFKIKKYCDKKNIDFLCTPFDLVSLSFLVNKLKLKTIKVSSGDITNYPLLYKIGLFKKNIIISSGNSNIREIDMAIKAYYIGYAKKNIKNNYFSKLDIKKYFNEIKHKITILHCVSSYPTPIDEINLNSIKILKSYYSMFKIGLSDHTNKIHTPLVAMGMGINVIEKHFTLHKFMKGPDHKASLNPNELFNMVKLIRDFTKSLGKYEKKSQKFESKNLKIIRRSIYAKKDILVGDIFDFTNIILKRPYDQKSDPVKFWKIIFTKSKQNFKKNDLI